MRYYENSRKNDFRLRILSEPTHDNTVALFVPASSLSVVGGCTRASWVMGHSLVLQRKIGLVLEASSSLGLGGTGSSFVPPTLAC
jgi:hypothetical protein